MRKKGTFASLQDWMVEGLGLSGARLIVYAIIYGISADGESACECTLDFFEFWTGQKRRNVITILQELEANDYIRRVELGRGRGNRAKFLVNTELADEVIKGAKITHLKKVQKTTEKCAKNDTKTCKKCTNTYLIYNNIYRTYSLVEPSSPEEEQKQLYNLFFWKNAVSPAEEVSEFVSYNNIHGWQDSKGRKYSTFDQRISLADTWQFKKGPKRVNESFLQVWFDMYDRARQLGDPFAESLVDERVNVISDERHVQIICTAAIMQWIEKQFSERKTTVQPLWAWINNTYRRNVEYRTIDN